MNNVRAYWEIAGHQLVALARAEAGLNPTAEQFRNALRSARQRRPDLARAYDDQRISLEGPDDIVRFSVGELEIEIPTPRGAGNLIAARVNQLVNTGEAPDVCTALDIARREAPGLAEIWDSR